MNRYLRSEEDFLALIAAKFPNTHETLILGRGDDCAEVVCPPQLAVSTDLFVENIHFRRAYFSPFDIGYKAIAVNISDVASAGAKPLGVSVGLVAPVPFPRSEAEGILEGMLHAVNEYGIALTGGDLSRGGALSFCVTIWGAPVIPEGTEPRFLRRGPVSPGDKLFLCGAIGLARAGLLFLEEQKKRDEHGERKESGKEAKTDFPAARAAHLRPVPLVRAGMALASIPGCRLMDVSDGLAKDLPRMLNAYGPERGAAITLAGDVLHPEVVTFAERIGETPIRFAFRGGEDYALLGACPSGELASAAEAVRNAAETPFLELGVVTERPGVILNGSPVTDAGFDHFG